MSHINPLTIETAGAAAETLGAIKQKLGVVPNIFATFAHSPAVLNAYLGFSDALGQAKLPADVREQIALAVAGENQCDYCASAHTMMAKGAGVSADEAARNLQGQASDPRTQAILRFSRLVVEERGLVDPQELQTLRNAGVSEQEIVEIIATISINIFTNYFNHIVDTEIDFPRIETGAGRRAA